MKKSIAKKWIAALRSGQYRQTDNILRDPDGFCCLGVLCNLHAQAHPEYAKQQHSIRSYGGCADFPPSIVLTWAGLRTNNGAFAGTALSIRNDNGDDFKRIAHLIEKNVDAL